MREYKEWQYVAKVVVGRSIDPEIYLSFFRQVPGRDCTTKCVMIAMK